MKWKVGDLVQPKERPKTSRARYSFWRPENLNSVGKLVKIEHDYTYNGKRMVNRVEIEWQEGNLLTEWGAYPFTVWLYGKPIGSVLKKFERSSEWDSELEMY